MSLHPLTLALQLAHVNQKLSSLEESFTTMFNYFSERLESQAKQHKLELDARDRVMMEYLDGLGTAVTKEVTPPTEVVKAIPTRMFPGEEGPVISELPPQAPDIHGLYCPHPDCKQSAEYRSHPFYNRTTLKSHLSSGNCRANQRHCQQCNKWINRGATIEVWELHLQRHHA